MHTGPTKWRAISDHRPETSEPLRVGVGDMLRFERRITEWKGWIWCTTGEGLEAWVPEAWVKVEGEACTMLRDYTSRELTVRKGETLLVEETESGWAWAENSAGERGWVPLDCLERL